MKKLKKFLAMTLTLAIVVSMLVTSGVAASLIVLTNGIYVLYSENGETCLNVQFAEGDNGRVVIDTADGQANEMWVITNDVFGNLTIRPYHDQTCFLSGENGFDQPLVIKKGISDRNGLWRASPQGDGKYVLKCVGTGYVIDCAFGHIDSIGNSYLTYEQNGFGAAQNVMPVMVSEFTNALTTGSRVTDLKTDRYYKVGLFGDRDTVLNSQYGLFSGANLAADPFNSELNEIVKFEHHGFGYYSIRFAGNADLCVYAPNAFPGTQLQLKLFDGSRECLWEVYRHNDGTYSFRNAKTGLYLDDLCCRTDTGTPLIQHTFNKCTAQHYYLDEVELPIQAPMDNMHCTWKSYSNMSWGSYTDRKNQDGTDSPRDWHLGLDVYGTGGIVKSASSGTVVDCSRSNSGANGRYITIESVVDGKTVYFFYAHLSSLEVNRGDQITVGQRIGVAGGSGYGSNSNYKTHLHFAVIDSLQEGGGYLGYTTRFSGDSVRVGGRTFYNPLVVLSGRVP